MANYAARLPAGGRSTVPAGVGLLVAAIAIGWIARWGPDWPAQEFRSWSAAHDGLTAWTNQWYAGAALPGYSVLFPVLGGLFGARLTGIGAVAAAFVGAAGFRPTSQRVHEVGFQAGVGFVLCADLLIGQVPYLVGVAFGAWALRAAVAGRPWLAGPAAALCSLASPLAGCFLLIAVPATACAITLRRSAALLAAGAGLVVATLVGGGGGPFPFRGRLVIWIAIFIALVLVLTTRQDRPMRVFAISYGIAAAAALAVANPVGGNIARLGQLVALPLAWMLAGRLRWRGPLAAAVLAAAAALWTAWPAVASIAHGASDPSRTRGYYAGLLRYLHTQDPRAGRLEVVFTREHWEALYVARSFPIARGWERQTDLAVNAALYRPLTTAAYRRWLDANGVALVALPSAPIDYGGAAEAALLRHPPGYLGPAWHDRNWRVWKVRPAPALVTGAASVRSIGTASFVLDFRRAGTAEVRIRASRMWTVTAGEACVTDDDEGWLDVTAPTAGTVTLRSRVGLPALSGAGAPRCS